MITIEKLSAAILNDPNYFQTIQTSINTTASASTTHNRTAVDAALALKADQSTTYNMDQLSTFLDTKPDDAEFAAAIAVVNRSTGLKSDKLSTHTKPEVNQALSDIIGAAPAALNTSSELATALNNDAS